MVSSKLLKKLIKDKTDFCVKVNNDDERSKLLSLFNSYENIRWINNGYRPTEIKRCTCNYPYYIILRNGKVISWYWEKCNEIKEIKFNDLFDNNNYEQEIHITRKGQEVHAILKENGKVFKHAVAKCHPEDEFDFKVGSKLAYNRLFEKDVKTPKPKHEFKVGDKVRIRQWDDMVEEFGLDGNGDIKCMCYFIREMKNFCHKTATITEIRAIFDKTLVYLKFDNENLNSYPWDFTTDMIEPYTPRIAKVGEYVRVIDGENEGKIFKCTKNFWETGGYFENSEYYYSDIVLFPKEYEVLDDYIPPLNCKFVVLEGSEDLTKGKIYEIKNGKFTNDRGGYFPLYTTLKDENDLKKYFSSKQERVKQTGYCYDGIKFIIIKE